MAHQWTAKPFPDRFAKDIDLKPKRLPNLPLSWVYPVMMYPEEQIIDECGLDCAIYLRILRFGEPRLATSPVPCPPATSGVLQGKQSMCVGEGS